MTVEHSAERDAGLRTGLDPILLDQWRAAACRLGGIPAEHPDVPDEYVYTANRLVSLIDDLFRVLPPGVTS